MPKPPTNDDLLNMAEAHARAVMIGGKDELVPIAHLVSADGEDFVIGCPWRNSAEKEMTQEMLRRLIKAGDVLRYALVMEAWIANAPPGWDPATMRVDRPIRDREDRSREAVMAVAVDREGHTVRMFETKRDDNGNCVDLVADKSATDHQGAFLNLIMQGDD